MLLGLFICGLKERTCIISCYAIYYWDRKERLLLQKTRNCTDVQDDGEKKNLAFGCKLIKTNKMIIFCCNHVWFFFLCCFTNLTQLLLYYYVCCLHIVMQKLILIIAALFSSCSLSNMHPFILCGGIYATKLHRNLLSVYLDCLHMQFEYLLLLLHNYIWPWCNITVSFFYLYSLLVCRASYSELMANSQLWWIANRNNICKNK